MSRWQRILPTTALASTLMAAALFASLGGCRLPYGQDGTTQTGTSREAAFGGRIEHSIRDSKPDFRMDPAAPAKAPNVLIILADDLGYSDIAPYGGEIRTPNLDRLAQSGIRYSNFTATSMCSPTRAALLTGLNHHSAGVGWVSEWDYGYPGYRGELGPDTVTLPQILQQNGYSTLAVGKWHLANGEHRSRLGPFDAWPTQKGFERYWGFLDGESDQFEPQYLVSGNEFAEVPKDPHFYLPDAMTDHAIGMLRDLRAVDAHKPFFLYYAASGVHAPHQTKPEDRERYRGRYAQGWDAVRSERFARQKALGLFPATTQMSALNDQVQPWSSLSEDQRRMYARFQENYAGFVDNLDQQVGRLIDYLRETGELDNTIIVFMSDNGASPEGDVEGQWNSVAFYHWHKTTTAENLQAFDRIGDASTHPHYPWGWMQASNTPFAYGKRSTWGGGIRVPLIISWPQGLAAHNEVRTQYHHVDDIAPTLLEALHISAPTQFRGHTVKPMEGTSMLYSFADASAPSHKHEQYYELEGNRGYYADGWKIVSHRAPDQKFDEPAWHLFNLNEDFAETHDLAAQMPDKVKELDAKWWADAERYQVLPIVDVGLLERSMYAKFIRIPGPDHVELHPGAGTIPHNRAPILAGKSYTISAQVDRSDRQQQGVLVAQGDNHSGYSFFVKDNHLYYERNVGYDVIRLVSRDEIPPGPAKLEFRYDKVSTGLAVAKGLLGEGIGFNRLAVLKGTGSLWINGRKSAEAAIDMPFLVGWEGLDVGEDRQSPVSPLYAGQEPFAFNGKLDKVVYDIK